MSAAILLPLLLVGHFGWAASQPENRPNIVFILADDLGFSDIAPYGSEVDTPHLTALANNGVRFTNYHTAANCAPARAMLLTGVNNHLAGVPNIPEMLAPEQRQHENYVGVLGDNVVTVATRLKHAGYHTYMAGKWHLGASASKRPSQRGFERTVALMDSGADNWEQRPYLPLYERANWFADGKRFELPDDFYSSRFLIDKTIAFIRSNRNDDQPFFAYVPFQAVHIPVQAPQEFIDKYASTYTEGWHVLRERRRLRASELGVVPADTAVRRMASTRDWNQLSDKRKRYEAKRMAVYAGMISAMDFHIGRLIAYLKAEKLYDNTLFVFTSDNGAEASGPDDPHAVVSSIVSASMGYHQDFERLGLKGSFNSISPSFASAAASPLSYYKFYAGEGGMRVPLIISGPMVARPNSSTPAFVWATDITPTLLAIAGVESGVLEDRLTPPVLPISGQSLLPLLANTQQRVHPENEAIGYELAGHAALFQGDYKLVRNQKPVGDGQWYLYNIAADPGEVRDLKLRESLRYQRMLAAYRQFSVENGVQPVPQGYSPRRQMLLNYLAKKWPTPTVMGLTIVGLLAFLLLPAIFLRYRRRGTHL